MYRGLLLALAVLAGCHSANPAFEVNAADAMAMVSPMDARVDEAPAEAPPADAAVQLDATVPEDAAAPDIATEPDTAPDLPQPDLPEPDLLQPDLPQPDLPAEPATPAVDLETGLVGFWPMDEGAGDQITDRSGQGNNGTLEGVPLGIAWVAGNSGQALYLNQNSGAGVMVRPSASLDRIQRFTVAAWVYREEVPRYSCIISRDLPGTNAEQYGLTFSMNELSIYLPPAAGMTTTLRSPTPFPVKQWVHAAATYDGETLRLYQSGLPQGTLAVRMSLPPTTTPLYLGTNKNSTLVPEPLHGRLDDVLLYERALTDLEILALASGMRPPLKN